MRTPDPIGLIADYVVGGSANLPVEVQHATARGVIDFLGVALAGAAEADMRPLMDYVSASFAPGDATALGLPDTMGPEAAAWINGAAGHVLDYDDCLDVTGGHPTAPILPAVLALAESDGRSAREALTAYAMGVQVMTRLGRCLNFRHYERGWHPTATLGVLGAAASVARLDRLTREQTEHALLIATSLASGIKGNFGSPMKPIQVGYAASKGITAARLVAVGVTANPLAFSGPQGFPAVFNDTSFEGVDWSPLAGLYDGWEILDPGLTFKLYACCGSTHAPVDVALELHRRYGIDPAKVRKVDVLVHPRRRPHTDRPDPLTGPQGKFSVQYVVAVALMRGAVTVADFTDDCVRDPAARALMEHIEVGDLPPEEQTVVPGRTDCYAATLRIELDDGTERVLHADAPKGFDPAAPVSDEDLRVKFGDTAAAVIGTVAAAEAYEMLLAWCGGQDRALSDFGEHVRRLATRRQPAPAAGPRLA